MFKADALTIPAMPAVLTLAAFAASSAMGQFYSVGQAGPGGTSTVRALSYDGRVAAGFTRLNGDSKGFYWTADEGRVDYGRRPGAPSHSPVAAISGDGNFIAGRTVEGGNSVGYRWSEATGYETFTAPTWPLVMVSDMNGDGSVIVGTLENGGFAYRPFRWTAAGGLEILRHNGSPIDAVARAVTEDGSMVVGSHTSGDAFVWTQEQGYRWLPDATGENSSSDAHGVSRDGRFVVGTSGRGAQGAMWTPTGSIVLGKLSDRYQDFIASNVSDDGSVVSGTSNSRFDPDLATVWTQASGIQTLADYLAANGIILPMNTILASCEAMSADGMTFAGTARIANQSNSSFGYVVTIPTPATSACIFAGILVSCRRKRG